jgi:hypothetical protein
VSVRLLDQFSITPLRSEWFAAKVQLVTVGLLLFEGKLEFAIAAPKRAELPMNAQLTTVALLERLHMPPPWEDPPAAVLP